MSADSHTSPAPTGTELSVAGVVSVFKAVRKHWAIVVAGMVIGGGGSLLYSKSSQRIYEASSLVEIDPRAAQPMGDAQNGLLDMGASLFWDSTQYYNTQYRVITSVPVMKAA